MEVGERKGGWPLRYLSSTIIFHILTAPKWPEHHRVFLSSSSPWLLPNVRWGRDNAGRSGGRNYKHSTFSDPPSVALDKISQIRVCLLVVPSSERERVGVVFLDIPRRDMVCIISWNLRLTCETEGLKVERSSNEVVIKTTSGCWPILPVLFCCLLCTHLTVNWWSHL